jgi:RimJ/RimL family protein N-acetyltransferase
VTSAGALLSEAKQCLERRDIEGAWSRLQEASSLASTQPSALSAQQHHWLRRHLYILSPLWSQPVRHGVVALRRCRQEDEAFFRSTFEDHSFTQRFNRQRPWSGDLARALHKFGQEPPALLRMLQWVVCLRDEPVGLISLSHLDLTNSRAEFSIGFPQSISAGISHKACLLALHFSFFVAGLHRLYGHVYEGNDPALQAAARIGFCREGFLVDHFRFQPGGFVGVHVVGLTRQQALSNGSLTQTVKRRIGQEWGKW